MSLTGKEFRGRFITPKENISLVSANTLHQQICITAKDQFESTNEECNLFPQNLTKNHFQREQLIKP